MKDKAGTTAASLFIVTSNHGFAAYAQDELRALMPGAKFEELAPAETYVLHSPCDRAETIRLLNEKEPIFVRHIHPVDLTIPLDGTSDMVQRIADAIADRFEDRQSCASAAVQIRKAARFAGAFEPAELRDGIIASLLQRKAIPTVVKHADRIVSVFLTDETAYVGFSAASDNLSDWAGGAIRFRKEEGQVSRAKFKLLEAEYAFGLDLSTYAKALDIGAAPGGWTSLLLERGVEVTAVDPADMHPTLIGHPMLIYLKRNAGDVKFKSGTYDLLVCDMSWSPKQMVKQIIPLLDALQPGGTAIITLKLMHGKPFQTVKDSVRAMQPLMALVKAKQLFHNRDELTICLRKTV